MKYVRLSVLFITLLLTLFGCTANNVDVNEDLKKHFEGADAIGTFGLFDNSRGGFTIYNLERFKQPFSPASTFKIVSALVALESGLLTTDSTVIPWDGISRENNEWNQDLSLYRAFRLSSVSHFQTLVRQLGRDTLQYWLDTLAYGNMKIGRAVDSCWLNGELQITPDEQLGLVKRLYFRQHPFRSSVQEQVKKMMIRENNAQYQLAYKTGLGTAPNGKPLGWMVGWIEENRHVYPFVLNLEMKPGKEASIVEAREKVLRGILTELGFFKGKM